MGWSSTAKKKLSTLAFLQMKTQGGNNHGKNNRLFKHSEIQHPPLIWRQACSYRQSISPLPQGALRSQEERLHPEQFHNHAPSVNSGMRSDSCPLTKFCMPLTWRDFGMRSMRIWRYAWRSLHNWKEPWRFRQALPLHQTLQRLSWKGTPWTLQS